MSFLVVCNIDLPLKPWSHVIRLANGIMSILSEGLKEWVLILENVNVAIFRIKKTDKSKFRTEEHWLTNGTTNNIINTWISKS